MKIIHHFVLIALTLFLGSQVVANDDQTKWYNKAWDTVKTTWNGGADELYVPFLSYHPPFAYSKELRDQFNEYPKGLGYGRGLYNQNGSHESVYVMGFLDSRSKTTYMTGYTWIKEWGLVKNEFKVGLGYTGFIMSRSNYFDGIPFPGILPVASARYKNLSVQATYTPGLKGDQGNILFMLAKWEFGKLSGQ